MLIMAEVTAEMGAELRASAMAAGTSVAAEVGRRLERLQRLETEDRSGFVTDSSGDVSADLRLTPSEFNDPIPSRPIRWR